MAYLLYLLAIVVAISAYFLVGVLSDAEPVLLRGAWGVVAGGVVLLLRYA